MVKRYDPVKIGDDAFMDESSYGDYVRVDDYAALNDENTELKVRLKHLEKKICELWMEV